MTQRSSKFRDIIKSDYRYRIDINPLNALFESSQLLYKSAEFSQVQDRVNDIIDRELNEDFVIGGHIDFNYLLEKIKTQEGFLDAANRVFDVKLVSLFIDLRNFTKRAMFIEDPGFENISEIAVIKQKAISTWIKLARFYQGHIHSITGDGLMILFGGTQVEDQDEWTVGARAFLLALRILESTNILNDELKEILKAKGLGDYLKDNNLLEIKVGIEYSPNTLMNPQGVIVTKPEGNIPVGEIKATSFEVDFSAKLLGYYGEAKRKIEGSPMYGRILLLGEKYKELMNFNDETDIIYLNKYTKQMFNKELSSSIYYLDCSDYKDKIIKIEDVVGLCDVYDSSEAAKSVFVDIARKDTKIQHGN
ncbi:MULTISPECIES: hypothetical protein [unclassified Paenibacillus]|uniref:hypothetical protein n=1 Tax=unclassified Paenibacillus TaxID=185978 RepID=UPI00070B412A|nr:MULTISPECIES: hypothetical protein [unclassified Paenibacillus]KQX67242.1 hypothetical protein ASD40_26450 [Paenibacillus sp. Root444D2]KRE49992.1 hypothetical protein ASG85_21300 [Paenibacillus sp. Soil724D2]